MRYALLCLAWVLFLAAPAYAVDNAVMGDACHEDDHYVAAQRSGTRELCFVLCDSVSQTGGQTSCQPADGIDLQGCAIDTVQFTLAKAPVSCEPGTMTIRHSDNPDAPASDNVWSTIGTITGRDSPNSSESRFSQIPKRYLRIEFSAIADTDCNAGERVDLVVSCIKK